MTAPTVVGAYEVGSTLSASAGTWDVPASRLQLSYQWLLGGTPIGGATDPTYTVPVTALGRPISVRVTATAPGAAEAASAVSTSSVVTSGGSTAVRATAAPVVTGTAVVGHTVTASTGSWTVPDADLAFTYRWVADGRPVAGATRARLVLPASLLRKSVGVVVTATVKEGSASGTSASRVTIVKAISTTRISLATRIRSTTRDRVTVIVTSAAVRQSGTVVVQVGERAYSAPVDRHGRTVVVLPRLSVGRHTVRALYRGAADVLRSTSASRTVTVVRG